MDHAFHLRIVSPSRVIVDDHVPVVEIPGLEGDFGVLPGHAPFFSMLRPGAITITYGDGTHRRFFAATGYADVTQTSCTVLSDHVQDLAEVSPTEVAEALSAAQMAVTKAENADEKEKAEKLLYATQTLSDLLAA